MEDYISDVEDWMSQVKDGATSVEDYDFLDRVSHGAPASNGSNGLANVGAYLAIYEEDGELTVDEDLVDELDSRQGSSRRNRFRNIVYDAQTQKREGKTLKEKGVNGHEQLSKMIEEFRSDADPLSRGDSHMTEDNKENDYKEAIKGAAGYGIGALTAIGPGPLTGVKVAVDRIAGDGKGRARENQTPVRDEEKNDTISSKPEEPTTEGGDNYMTDYEDPAELVAAAEEGEVTFEQFQAEVNAYDDLSEEEAAYLGSTGAQLYLRDEVEDLETATEALLKTKYDSDDLIDDTVEEMEGWRQTYVEHMNSAAVSIINSTGYVERGRENVEEARENLEEKNEKMEDALDDSPLDDLRSLESDVNDALTPEDATTEE